MRFLYKVLLPAIALIAALAAQTQAQQPPVYHMTDLSDFFSPGTTGAVNALGQATGWVNPGNLFTEVFSYSGGVLNPVGIAVINPVMTGINKSGTLIGNTTQPTFGTEGFVYSGGQETLLGFLPGDDQSYVYAINDAGTIVGSSYAPPNPQFNNQMFPEPVVVQNGVMSDLGLLPGSDAGEALGINNAGVIVGYCVDTQSGMPHAVIFHNPGVKDLGTISGLGGIAAEATSVNNLGQITGWYELQTGQHVAFIYDHGKVTSLPRLLTIENYVPASINDLSDIVGQFGVNEQLSNGFLYTGGQMYDLNTLLDSGISGYTIGPATSISASGQIAAQAIRSPRFDERPVILTREDTPQSPVVTTLTPASVRGAQSLTLTIQGTGFTRYSVLDWNNSPAPTKFVSATKITATITPAVNPVLATNIYPTTATLVVVNPGGASTPFSIAITEPKPVLTSLSPNTVPFDSEGMGLFVTGQGFIPGAQIKFGSYIATAAYRSSTQIGIPVPASLLTRPQTVNVSVINSPGMTSNVLPFTITGTHLTLTVGTLTRDSSNVISVPITITNTGPNAALSLEINGGAQLAGTGTAVPTPIVLGDLSVHQSVSTTLTFAATPFFKPGSKQPLLIQCEYVGGTNRLIKNLTMP